MAKRYSVAPPSTGTGGAKVLFAGGGGAKARTPRMAPGGGFDIDLGLDKMRQRGEDDEKRKYLIEGGLDPRAVALMNTQSLDLGVRAMADNLMEAKKEEAAAAKLREGGTYLQDQARLSGEPPRNWIGSEYERTKGTLDSPAAKDLGTLNPVTGEFEDIGKYTDPSGEEPVTKPAPIVPPQGDPAANLFPWLKETGDKRISPQQGGSLPYGTPETQDQIDAASAAAMAKEESDPFWNIGAETFRKDTDLGPVPERNLTRAEEGLAAFLGLSPEVATGVFAEHKAFQEELGKKPKVVNPYTNAERVVKVLPNREQTIAYYEKGKPATKENQIGVTMNIGIPDATKGERFFTLPGFDKKGNPQVTVMTLDFGLNVTKAKVFPKGTGPEGKTVPKQVLLLSTFLMDKAIEDHPSKKEFEKMNEVEQSEILSVLDTARNPAAYFKTPAGERNLQEFVDFMKDKGMAEVMLDILKEINKMGDGGNPFLKKQE